MYRIAMTVFFATAELWAQLSPGPLHEAHADLEGLRQCVKCHEIGSKEFAPKCLSCHALLKERIDAGRGLHAREGYEACEQCHIDHQGREFDLIHWGESREAFDHALTGYPLTGLHAGQACEACHRKANIANPEPLAKAHKNLDRTFLGLSQDCLSCHRDEHRGQVGGDCLDCHRMEGWRPAPGFRHDRARFPLLGAHQKLECNRCHPTDTTQPLPNDPGFMRFSPLAHESCLDCHRDEHRGQLPGDCRSCHRMDGWRPASRFDHGRARFSLTGAHSDVSCDRCHKPATAPDGATFTRFRGIPFGRCGDCHQDIHEGRFGDRCRDCHATDGWRSVPASAFDHDRTRYPLEGMHRSLECAACHPAGRPLKIKNFGTCSDCHGDAHQGQLDRVVAADGCRACHSVAGFKPSSYSVARHDQTAFPLEGGHRATPCIACHVLEGRDSWQFRLNHEGCTACHADPHRGAIDPFIRADRGCETCHETASWQSSAYDHGTFPLTGRHRGLSCGSCHGKTEDPSGLAFLNTPTACGDCHPEPHQGQFAASHQNDCQACHHTLDWTAANFDHNRDAAFALDGAHREVACRACHTATTIDERETIRYKPIDPSCETCHGRKERKEGP